MSTQVLSAFQIWFDQAKIDIMIMKIFETQQNMEAMLKLTLSIQ